MPTDVIMPQMGESIFEGTITKWLKKAGDTVVKDEPLFEISTDKVDAEIPAPVAGVLIEIRIAEGETVQINTVVAVIGGAVAAAAPKAAAKKAAAEATKAEPVKSNGSAAKKEKAKQAEAAPSKSSGTNVVMPQMGESIFEGTITKWLKNLGDTVAKDEPLFEISTDKVDAEIPSPVAGVLTEIRMPEGATVEINKVVAVIGGSGASAAAAVEASTPAQGSATEEHAAETHGNEREGIRSSPLVRRIAKENKVNLAAVAGTGSSGRITKEDILKHLKDGPARPAARKAAEPAKAMTDEVVPLSRMRAIIAQRMVESKRTSPHVHSVYKVDMTRVVGLREREKAGFERRNGVKLTYMPFISAAAIAALRRFPIVNSSLIEDKIHYHANIHLGIAVALEWGLIVPVVRGSEGRDFVSLAKTINDLAARARAKKLSPDEVGGSTFTLTNSGIFGDEFGTPIINQPESAILAIGGLRKEPAVLTDAEGNDSIAIRSMQHFCLGFDHRLIDGADAGKFMSEFKQTLENWDAEIG